MTSADLRGLVMAAETARAEADALRTVLSAERASRKDYEARVEALRALVLAERESWRALADSLNADLRVARKQRVSWGISGMVFGVIAGSLLK